MLWDAISNKNDFYIFNFTVCMWLEYVKNYVWTGKEKKEKR